MQHLTNHCDRNDDERYRNQAKPPPAGPWPWSIACSLFRFCYAYEVGDSAPAPQFGCHIGKYCTRQPECAAAPPRQYGRLPV